MGIFKKSLTAEEISKAIADLTNEDKKKVFEQSFKDRLDESVGEQEHDDGNEDSQNAKDRVDESLGAEEADASKETVTEPTADDVVDNADEIVTEEHHDDVIQALTARVEALETKVAEYADILEAIADLSHEDCPIGVAAQADVGESDDALSEDDRIMSKYNPNWRRG